MYFTELPDHTKPSFDEQLHFSRFKKHNIIFNALSARSNCDWHVGCLSFKTVTAGEEEYTVDGRTIVVRPGQFLILNDDQPYGCRIRNGGPTKVFSVFFKKEFARDVVADVINSEAVSMDNAGNSVNTPVEFFQTLNLLTEHFQSELMRFIARLETDPYGDDKIDEYLVFLLRYLLHTHRADLVRMATINALRASTRLEIYKRLCIARDLLHSCWQEPITLQTISRASCLSVPQLIRQFKNVFQVTPHQYLVHLRLQQAAVLLQTTNLPIREITVRCGFEDASAFGRAFRSMYCIQPEMYRKSRIIE